MSTLPARSQPPFRSAFTQLLNHWPLPAYVVLAFAGAWLAVLPLVLAQNGLGLLPGALPQLPFLTLGALAGPALAACLITGATSGKAGVRHLLRRYLHWRVGFQWYLLALFGPLVVLILGACVVFGAAPLTALVQQWPRIFTTYLPVILVFMVVGGPLGEELGWRGFALPRLQQRLGPVRGSLLLGLIWGIFHLPTFFGAGETPFTILGFAGTILSGMAFSIIVTWIYNNTAGSVLMAVLLHAASNAATSFGGQLLPAVMPAWAYTVVISSGIGVIAYGACAVIIHIFTCGRLSYTSDHASHEG